MPLRLLALLAGSFRLAIFSAAIGMAQIGLVDAAELTAADSEDGKTILLLDGDIEFADGHKLEVMALALDIEKRGVSALFLNSRGGRPRAAARMVEVVRRYKISTIVADGAECASACFNVFAAGHKKCAGNDAEIGVHAASDDDGREAHRTTFEAARLLSELGVPPAIVGKLVLTPADEMAWLTPDDLLSMNVTITDALHWPGAAARPTPFEAAVKPDGLSWPEYVAEAFERSYDRFGPGNFREICDVYRFVCVRYFYHVDKHGLVTRVTTFEDMSGNVVRREFASSTGPAPFGHVSIGTHSKSLTRRLGPTAGGRRSRWPGPGNSRRSRPRQSRRA